MNTFFILLYYMQTHSYEKVSGFTFYRLQEFQDFQVIINSKNSVKACKHKESNLEYVIKEIPYDLKTLKIYYRLSKIANEEEETGEKTCLAPMLGISIITYRLDKRREGGRKEGVRYILVFMQKCGVNLNKYVEQRRLSNNFLKQHQIQIFCFQMLNLLEKLQKRGLCHRDIKPENILFDQGSFYLCDFDEMVVWELSESNSERVELSTVAYSSPQYLRYIKNSKEKYFDPFKLDVYSLGLTLLFICSVGRFDFEERINYIYGSGMSHYEFISEQRRKYLKQTPDYRPFNIYLKIMLEEDEYKRDDFITLKIKVSLYTDSEQNEVNSEVQSLQSFKTTSTSKLLKKKFRKQAKKQLEDKVNRQNQIYGWIALLLLAIFCLFCFFK